MAGTDRDIYEASKAGDTEEVERLIRTGVDLNKKKNDDDSAPIHLAAGKGHTATVKLLLDHGAKIDEKDDDGWTPISQAAKKGHKDTVKLFLDHGANIDLKNNYGWTPIHRAADKGHTDIVKLFYWIMGQTLM